MELHRNWELLLWGVKQARPTVANQPYCYCTQMADVGEVRPPIDIEIGTLPLPTLMPVGTTTLH